MSKKKSYPLSKVYGLLEPGPVVLVTTLGARGPNIMAMSWQTMLDFEPPLVACVISNRNYSFELLKASRECVLNIPTRELARQVVGCGNTRGAKTDKFHTFGLTAVAGTVVKPPLIAECFANLECRVTDGRMINKYNMFILEVLKAWIDPAIKHPLTLHHRGNGAFMVAGETIRLASRMK